MRYVPELIRSILYTILAANCLPFLLAQKPQVNQPSAVLLKPQEVTFSQLNAEALVGLCRDVETDMNSPGSKLCLFYLTGFGDGYAMAMLKFNHEKQSGFCPPQEVTRPQMAKVIVKYGADHPNELWINSALFTATALKDAYPCQE